MRKRYLVYLINPDGSMVCYASFTSKEAAMQYAAQLNQKFLIETV